MFATIFIHSNKRDQYMSVFYRFVLGAIKEMYEK